MSLFIQSQIGPLLKVTGIFTTIEAANTHCQKHDDGICDTVSIQGVEYHVTAGMSDKGRKLKQGATEYTKGTNKHRFYVESMNALQFVNQINGQEPKLDKGIGVASPFGFKCYSSTYKAPYA